MNCQNLNACRCQPHSLFTFTLLQHRFVILRHQFYLDISAHSENGTFSLLQHHLEDLHLVPDRLPSPEVAPFNQEHKQNNKVAAQKARTGLENRHNVGPYPTQAQREVHQQLQRRHLRGLHQQILDDRSSPAHQSSVRKATETPPPQFSTHAIANLCLLFRLFIILAFVLTIIVRRKRQRTDREEAEKNRHIDDDIGDVEMVITGPRNPEATYKHWEARGASPNGELDLFEQDSRFSRDVSPVKR